MAAPSRRPLSWGWIAGRGPGRGPGLEVCRTPAAPGPRTVSRETSRLGRELFTHRFTEHDPLTGGDGLGPVFNASSCVECHNQGGVGGRRPGRQQRDGLRPRQAASQGPAPVGRRPPACDQHMRSRKRSGRSTRRCRPDRHSPLTASTQPRRRYRSPRETRPRSSVMVRSTPSPTTTSSPGSGKTQTARVRQARPRGGVSKIKGRVARLADGRIGRFGWKLEFATLGDFVKAACANELGLSNPGRPQATPLGHPEYKAEGVDLTDEQCGLMADFIRGLPHPVEAIPTDPRLAERSQGRQVAVPGRSAAPIAMPNRWAGQGVVLRLAPARHG